uniref:Uncharacterized protein At5g43822 n=1 Tax=Rhizophora mucronata TaxID=61149 RepID=A0A2P2LKG1_RHIMU
MLLHEMHQSEYELFMHLWTWIFHLLFAKTNLIHLLQFLKLGEMWLVFPWQIANIR